MALTQKLQTTMQSLVAFFAVISTGFFIFVVPILCVVALVALAVLSFWPVIVVALPFLFMSFTVASIILCVIATIVWKFFRQRAASFLGSRAFFLLPFHALFLGVVVSVFSFWWSIALGAALFVQGEVDFNTVTVNSVWDECVERFDHWSWPIFEYFPMTVRRDKKLNPTSIREENQGRVKYLFCYHPHGIYAIGLFSLVFRHASGFSQLFPTGRKGVLVGVASALLHVPVLGRLVSWFGFIPASNASLDLACETNRDVVIVPGGIAEMTLVQQSGVERLYLQSRRGFIRLAIRHGRPLVPVYCFGETSVFQQYGCFQRTRQWLSRKLKISIVFFRGRNCTLVPRRVPLNVVIGTPIHVMKSKEPTDEYVEMIHKKYTEDLINMFDRHKGDHPLYENAKLKLS